MRNEKRGRRLEILKAATGISGFDDVTGGGLPRGRPTLVCGAAGSGKTLLGVEFIVRGAVQFGEPGVILTFEEDAKELAENVASLGFDLEALVRKKKIFIDYFYVERSEIEETGDWGLDGLFIRLEHAVSSVGARRIHIDTLETLFAALPSHLILRAELRRLFRWLKEKELTAIVTAERGEGALTRHGLEEYISDCVILLDNRMEEQVATRRLRIVKYRGTRHGSDEYPFLIDEGGFSVLPVTSLGLKHKVSTVRVSTGVPGLDEMLGGEGYFAGSTILVSGTAGSGKSTLAAHLVASACARGEQSLYLTFEESPDQVVRNMRSIGLDLEPWVAKGLLRIHPQRPFVFGLEMHLIEIHRLVSHFRPAVVALDPISDLMGLGRQAEVHSMLVRTVDHLKGLGVTTLMTSLVGGGRSATESVVGISSLIDTWIALQTFEVAGERNRGVSIVKSRGMAHSNRIREFRLGADGLTLLDAYSTPDGILTGSAREVHEEARALEIARKRSDLDRRRRETEGQIDALRAKLAADEEDLAFLVRAAETAGGPGHVATVRGIVRGPKEDHRR